MVTTEEEECGGIPDFERPQIEHTLCDCVRSPGIRSWVHAAHLNAEVPSVYVVSQEEIPRGSGVAADLKELHQIVLVMGGLRSVLG